MKREGTVKAIVFGGSGFLGSHVAEALTKAGHDVSIYDQEQSPHLVKGQKMIVGNILDEAKVNKVIKSADIVYNFAGVADMDEAAKNPVEAVRNNILGNTMLLESSRKNKVKRFVFASSIYVYSSAGSFYRSSKQACELIIENYHQIFGLDYTILRYGSIYGPRSNEENWISQILKQAITKGKITRYGDGEELREYIHVEDAARCSVEILADEYRNEHVIITGHQQIKVKDLLSMVREIMGGKISIEYRSVEDRSCPYDPSLHYQITPYSFKPKIAKKLVSRHYLDLGQGLMSCMDEIYRRDYASRRKVPVARQEPRLTR